MQYLKVTNNQKGARVFLISPQLTTKFNDRLPIQHGFCRSIRLSCNAGCPLYRIYELAGLPALQSSEPGQVRKEAATAIYASAGGKARLLIGVSAR